MHVRSDFMDLGDARRAATGYDVTVAEFRRHHPDGPFSVAFTTGEHPFQLIMSSNLREHVITHHLPHKPHNDYYIIFDLPIAQLENWIYSIHDPHGPLLITL